MSKHRNCFYNPLWELDVKYKDWLQSVPADKHKVYCRICNRSWSIKSMGISSLNRHMSKDKTHISRVSAISSTPTPGVLFMYQSQSQPEPVPEQPKIPN